MAWYQPRDLRDYLLRLLSLPVFLLLLVMVFGAAGELRFGWAERLIGAYLATTNDQRPESGAIWKVDQSARIARQTLDKIVTDRISFQRETREATDFADLSQRLQPEQGIMLSVGHFRRLYLQLPEAPAREVVSPLRLLQILSRRNCDRVYIKKTSSSDGLSIFLLNADNQVLETLDMPPDLLRFSGEDCVLHEGRLENWSDFQGRIYPAERFFAELETLAEEVRSAIVLQPAQLLAIDGPIVRVGIGNEVSGGFIRLGFEVLAAGVPRVMQSRGREWAVWQVHERLEARRAAGAAGAAKAGGLR